MSRGTVGLVALVGTRIARLDGPLNVTRNARQHWNDLN